MERTMSTLMGGLPGDEASQEQARLLATLPMRLGGLGLRSAQRMAPASYWPSWADAIHMIHERLPTVANAITHQLSDVQEATGCVRELQSSSISSVVHGGRRHRPERDHHQQTSLSQARGHTDGNITVPLLLSTTSGGA